MRIDLLITAAVFLPGLGIAVFRLTRDARRRSRARRSAIRLSDELTRILRDVGAVIRPGVSTAEVDAYLGQRAIAADLIPYFQGYGGYPFASTASVNEEVINTLPSDRVLAAGDILKLQFGISDGCGFACQSWTYPVGAISEARRRLLKDAGDALLHAADHVTQGATAGTVGAAIAAFLSRCGLRGSRDYVGCRMSHVPRERPRIACDGPGPDAGERLTTDMVLHLVVIAHAGAPDVHVDADGWNVKTDDGSDSAMFSHMVLVGSKRADILTDRHRRPTAK